MSLEQALATLSRSYKDGSEIDPDGLARIYQIHPVAAQRDLEQAVTLGKAYCKEGWFGPSAEFCKEIAEKVQENNRIENENRKKFNLD